MIPKRTKSSITSQFLFADGADVLHIILEGETDVRIASAFLQKSGIPLNRINFIVANGLSKIQEIIESLKSSKLEGEVAVLVDLDINNNYEAEHVARLNLHADESDISIFTAVPSIEAWLFADIESIRDKSKSNKRTYELLSRLPLPDDIPHPRHLAFSILRLKDAPEKFISEININIATSRSPSLRKFILGVESLLNVESKVGWEKEYVRTVGRDIFSKLVDEVTPPDAVIYKTLDGDKVTAKEMSKHIHDGTNIGLTYSVDVLRIARDMLARNSRK